eukprot:g6638.t2
MARPRRRVRKPGLCAAAVLLGLLVVTILAAVTTVQSEPDIPFDRYGHVLFTQGSSGAATKVVEAYGHQAEFLYRLFPLPYHRNAFTAAKAAKVVRLYSNSNDETGSFLTAVFEGQDRISNDATEDMTQYEIEAVLAEWVTSTTGVSMDAFNTGMSDDDVEAQSRIQFKYGCLHGVFGTPQVFVGGVWAENLDGEETFQDWQDLLEPLVGGVAATAEMNGRTTMSVV